MQRFTKTECLQAFQASEWFVRLDARAHLIARTVLQRDNGIEARRLAVDSLAEVFEIEPNTLARRFLTHAPVLAAQAAERALAQAGLNAGDIWRSHRQHLHGLPVPMEQARHSGAHAFQPWSVQAINGAPGNWRCVVRAQDSQSVLTLEGPVFIAANGSWEPLPSDRASRPTAHRTSDLLAFKANDAGARLAHGLLPIRSFNGGYGGMVGAGEGVTTVACCVRRDRLESLRRSLPGLSAGAAVQQMLKSECLGVREALETATRDGPWLAAGPLHPRICVGLDDGLLRIGNAAGEAHPIVGEGMSTALQSAWLLCSQLLAANDPATASSAAWQCGVQRRYAAPQIQASQPPGKQHDTYLGHIARQPCAGLQDRPRAAVQH